MKCRSRLQLKSMGEMEVKREHFEGVVSGGPFLEAVKSLSTSIAMIKKGGKGEMDPLTLERHSMPVIEGCFFLLCRLESISAL